MFFTIQLITTISICYQIFIKLNESGEFYFYIVCVESNKTHIVYFIYLVINCVGTIKLFIALHKIYLKVQREVNNKIQMASSHQSAATVIIK